MVLNLARQSGNLANIAAAAMETLPPEAQAHVRLAVDSLLRAKHHLQTAARLAGEGKEGKEGAA
jgi:hypothetical protein